MSQKIIEQRYGDWIPGDLERVKAIVKMTEPGGKILDIGCGTGFIGEQLIKKGCKVYGVDYSLEAVKKAKQKGIIAVAGDITKKAVFQGIKFDGIILGEIIEHIIDTDAFLQDLKKKLKSGGYVIITTPNLATLGRRLLLLFGKNPHIEYYYRADSAGHVKYFVRDTLFDLLKYNGFKIEKFTSDIVNFNGSGSVKSSVLAGLWPGIGRTLIVKAVKNAV
ncbi:MAG: hypothetical protein CVV21_01650 [Candidatus Goldiibacteriota bacterium HGW-Goldbacteria-1]|nr:MAG: hypothetical protein CVV21_01650 [Candidatus Goldiibacteriota bacterium HGW-Goldbacteria-1]